MKLPCEVGLRCPYRYKDGAECDASWHGRLPDECPIVKEGSPLDAYLMAYEEANGGRGA